MKPALHFVGFRGDEYLSAVRVFGKPGFIHMANDLRMRREVVLSDTIVFANGAESKIADGVTEEQRGWFKKGAQTCAAVLGVMASRAAEESCFLPGAPTAPPSADAAMVEARTDFIPMDQWDQRDETVLLLVDYRGDGDHALDDAEFAITIGHNNDHNVGAGEGQGWQFAGWCWSHDHYVQGKGHRSDGCLCRISERGLTLPLPMNPPSTSPLANL